MKKYFIIVSESSPDFDKSIGKDEFLQFAFRGTRENQLFLNNSVSQNLDNFRPVYNWFKDSLVLITPNSRYEFDDFPDEESHIHANMSEILPLLDTGIARLCSENISIDNIPLAEKFKTTIREKLKEGGHLRLQGSIITRKNGELAAKKLNTYHLKENGEDVKFEIQDEIGWNSAYY